MSTEHGAAIPAGIRGAEEGVQPPATESRVDARPLPPRDERAERPSVGKKSRNHGGPGNSLGSGN